ncbi:hypothetical protein V6N11_001603 [Hibiscus sabdariffa]|uniref:Reverse transcriptase zinc-binding domain-containing protein n=1 Tax=Hibiscus sabdariffa TaxID=183260 RepID=A0ABR2S070_9ROSI
MPVLPKIRIFGWRPGQGAVPVGYKVKAAGLGDGTCKLCGSHIETILHAMRDCSSVQEVLITSGMDSLLPQGPFRDYFEWLEASHSVMSSE